MKKAQSISKRKLYRGQTMKMLGIFVVSALLGGIGIQSVGAADNFVKQKSYVISATTSVSAEEKYIGFNLADWYSLAPMNATGENDPVFMEADTKGNIINGENNQLDAESSNNRIYGNNNTANSLKNSTIIGDENQIDGGRGKTDNNLVVGNRNQVMGEPNTYLTHSIIVGNDNKAIQPTSHAVLLGNNITADGTTYTIGEFINGDPSKKNTEAVTTNSSSLSDTVAIGQDIKAGTKSVAVGGKMNVMGGSVAVGYGSESSEDSVSIGLYAQALHGETTAVGAWAFVNSSHVAALGDRVSVGNGSEGSVAIGGSATIGNGTFSSIAIGGGNGHYAELTTEVQDNAKWGIALGAAAKVHEGAQLSNAIGYAANIGKGAWGSNAWGYGASIGEYAQESNAIGRNTSIGDNTKSSNAIGKEAAIKENITGSDAIGSFSEVNANYSTALGSQSKVETGDILTRDNYTSKFDWDAQSDVKGVVSVGSRDFNRRIIHVANGRIAEGSTDAVNGGQLYSVWKDLYNQIVNPNKNPAGNPDGAGGTTSGTSTGATGSTGGQSQIPGGSLSNPVNPDRTDNKTDQDTKSKSDFQLVNGADPLSKGSVTYTDKEGKTQTLTTGYKADANGNMDLIIRDKAGANGDEATERHVVLTDVASKMQQDINTQNIEKNTESIQILNGRMDEMGARINKIGAGAAALAALHPLDFDPDEKLDFAAGFGNYGGENAVAIGAFYRPNEDTMFSVGGTFGNGENMVNAGISFKVGQKNHISVNRVAMAKEIIELRKQMEDVHSFIADGIAGRELDLSKIQLFPDIPENHWAYDYVTTLAGNGLLEGYPDGNFKGNRQLTRYEMAAILYRAMMNGARLSAKALKEFAPELDRIRVDTISQDKNGKPDIQRVRTVTGRE